MSTRGLIVAALSAIGLARGIAYIRYQDLPYGLDIVSRIIPIWVFAVIWIVTGICGLWIAATARRGVVVLSFLFASFALWGLGYMAAWALSGFTSTDWVPASYYLLTTVIVGAASRLRVI